jgi:hypothetical protein
MAWKGGMMLFKRPKRFDRMNAGMGVQTLILNKVAKSPKIRHHMTVFF